MEEKPTAFIVPGIAFTRQGERLGRGLGFYDRLLSQHPYVPKIGLCHSSQLVAERLPVEKHDVKMQYLCTDKMLVKCKSSV